MLTFSRVLLFAFALAGLLYSSTVNSSAYVQVTLYVVFAFAFVRAISSEPSPSEPPEPISKSSTVPSERVHRTESTVDGKRVVCDESTVEAERPRHHHRDFGDLG